MHSWQPRGTVLALAVGLAAAFLVPISAFGAGTEPTTAQVEPAAGSASTTAATSPEVDVEQTKVPVASSGIGSVEQTSVKPFRMAGVTWKSDASVTGVSVKVQVREDGTWSDWKALDAEDNDLGAEGGRPGTEPLWLEGSADGIAVKVEAATGTPTDVKVTTIDPGKSETVTGISNAKYDLSTGSLTTTVSDGTPKVVPMPSIITRAQWKAGAGTSCDSPRTQPKALGVVIHHTAGSNSYSKADSAALVRSYQTYHVKGHGWCDIGYNFLVDRFGQVFEGRKGGILNQVRAAHSGVDAVNQWATGISMMGNFDVAEPPEAMKAAVVRLVGWRLRYFGDNPTGTYSAGGKTYKVITGHRDVTSTACPGKYGYAWLGASGGLRDRVSAYLSKATSAAGAPVANLAAPTGLKAVIASSTSVSLSWTAVPGAPGYAIAYGTDEKLSSPSYINGVTTNSRTVTGLKPGTTYWFLVTTYEPILKTRLGAFSAPALSVATTATTYATPSKVAITATGSTALKFGWTRVAGAPGYRVQYSTSSTFSGAKYVYNTSPEVRLGDLKPSTTYYVRVAVATGTSGIRYTGYSAAGSGATKAAAAAPSSTKNAITIPSSKKVVFKGHGYGHGIGMSQYGAEGAARSGVAYDKILAHYYPGTSLSTKSGKIRVLITGDTTSSVEVVAASKLVLNNLATKKYTTLPTTMGGRKVTRWMIDAPKDKSRSVLKYKTNKWYTYGSTWKGEAQFQGPSTIGLVLPSGTIVKYRGVIRSTVPKKGSTARDTVNILTIEQYTGGVVTREMPSSWHAQALRAQAVAARTYGVRAITSSRHYDICDTTACQVYGGASAETSTGVAAVKATAGKIVTYKGAPAFTQFSSSSGGWTNKGSMPYLTPVQDSWDKWSGNKNHAWSITVTAAKIQKAYPSVGTVKKLTVKSRAGGGYDGGRVTKVTITGSKGSKTISGVDARWAFGLRSDWFAF